jgi:hypothetical protein
VEKMRYLTDEQKEGIRQTLIDMCPGTPLDEHETMIWQYIGGWVINLVQNVDTVYPTCEDKSEEHDFVDTTNQGGPGDVCTKCGRVKRS